MYHYTTQSPTRDSFLNNVTCPSSLRTSRHDRENSFITIIIIRRTQPYIPRTFVYKNVHKLAANTARHDKLV